MGSPTRICSRRVDVQFCRAGQEMLRLNKMCPLSRGSLATLWELVVVGS
jgi:hypothetical protein